MKKIGFIGLGHMGFPMAKNCLAAGYELKVFDLAPDPMEKLKELGAQPCKNIKSLCENSEIIITMLPKSEHVKQVYTQKDGIFESAKSNSLCIDSSSIDIKITQELSEMAKQKNLLLIDAPVSGGVLGAENASLTFMVGGETTDFESAKPILESMGKNIIHVGKAGLGQAAKICNNMLLGISMIGVCEAFNLAEKLDLPAQKLFDISSQSSGQCWSLNTYCPAPNILENTPSSNNYEPGFTANMMLKDLELSQNAAQNINLKTPLGEHARDLYKRFTDNGFGETDFSGIIKLLKDNTAL